MLILVSSAKTLRWDSDYSAPKVTMPAFISKAEKIAKVFKGMSKKSLQSVLSVNEQLASLNYDRYKNWKVEHTMKNARPAIATYAGQVYRELTLMDYTAEQKKYLQESVRILSGLYGVLRAYDLIRPYRLEMSTSVKVGSTPDLYAYWKDDITNFLNEEIKTYKHTYIVNIASQEYSQAVELHRLDAPVVTMTFRQKKNGIVRSYGIPTRIARAHMLSYLVDTQAKDIKKLLDFKRDGYRLASSTDTEYVFVKTI